MYAALFLGAIWLLFLLAAIPLSLWLPLNVLRWRRDHAFRTNRNNKRIIIGFSIWVVGGAPAMTLGAVLIGNWLFALNEVRLDRSRIIGGHSFIAGDTLTFLERNLFQAKLITPRRLAGIHWTGDVTFYLPHEVGSEVASLGYAPIQSGVLTMNQVIDGVPCMGGGAAGLSADAVPTLMSCYLSREFEIGGIVWPAHTSYKDDQSGIGARLELYQWLSFEIPKSFHNRLGAAAKLEGPMEITLRQNGRDWRLELSSRGGVAFMGGNWSMVEIIQNGAVTGHSYETGHAVTLIE